MFKPIYPECFIGLLATEIDNLKVSLLTFLTIPSSLSAVVGFHLIITGTEKEGKQTVQL